MEPQLIGYRWRDPHSRFRRPTIEISVVRDPESPHAEWLPHEFERAVIEILTQLREPIRDTTEQDRTEQE